MTFGKRLKKARTERHLTQKQLAEMLSVKHNSISNWENDINKPDPTTIELICGILDITPNYLLSTTENEFSPAEKLLIKMYKELDEHGRELVDFILEKEHERISLQNKNNVCYIEDARSGYTAVNAAHALPNASTEDKLHDEDIMDDENF